MTNFKKIKISEIFNIISGFAFKKDLFSCSNNNIPIIRIQNISGKKSEYVYYPYNEKIDEKFIVKNGDFLLPLSGSFFKLVKWSGKGKYYLNQRIANFSFKENIRDKLDENFINNMLNIIEDEIFKMGNSANNNLRLNDIKNISIKIPIDKNGNFDLEKQKEIAGKYEKIEEIKNKIKLIKEDFEEKVVRFEFKGKSKKVSIKEIFELGRGKSLYTREYGNNNKGEYPVYSAGKEKLTSINTFDFDGEYLTWATNGFAGYLKMLNGKFSLNADRGIFIKKSDLIDIDFINYSIAIDLRNLTKGRIGDKGKNEFTKLSPKKIEDNIFINIPIDKNGNFDLEKQKEISEKYEKIEKIKTSLVKELEYLEKVKVEI